MTAHVLYCYTAAEAADISGDPYPELLSEYPCDPTGRLPYLVDDGANIALDDDDVNYFIGVANICTTILLASMAFGLGYLVGWVR